MKKIAALMVLALIVAVSAGCEKKVPQEPGRAPNFVLKDIHGKEHKLSDYRGKVVLLDFWATWCGPCRLSIPDLNEIEARFKDRDFALLAISVNDSISTLKSFIKENDVAFTVLVNDRHIERLYDVISIPTTFLIDKDGKIVKKHLGYIPGMADALSKDIEELL
jgi:cytochrome c biogenesis protein CcmG/thiol:disulfide interchange protein DsbE